MATAFAQPDPPILASHRRAGDSDDAYRIWVEGPILRLHCRGQWDLATAKAYTLDVARIIADIRRTQSGLRAVVDRRDIPTFEAGVPEILIAAYRTALRPGDRLAIVVDSSMTKGYLRQVGGREETETCLSISAAQTWVLAYG